MRLPRLSAVLLALLLVSSSLVAAAQSAPTRIVVFPFDTSRSVDALGLASATALQRALNQVDGVYVPPVGDALLVLQRASDAGVDPLASARRLFQADAVVLAQLVGQNQLQLELVVAVAGEERSTTLRGTLAELSSLWRELAERVLSDANVRVAPADLAQVRAALPSAPSLPALGPLGVASARLPGVRLADLQLALELDPESAWLRAETARAAVLEGDLALAQRLAAEAATAAPGVAEVLLVQAIVLAASEDAAAADAFRAVLDVNPQHAQALAGLAGQSTDASERAALLERAIAAAPRLVDAHVALVMLQTDPQRRLQVLRRATERVPDSLTLQRALLEDVLAAGDPRGALSLLQQAVADPIGRSSATYALAAQLPDTVGREALAFVREGRERYPLSSALAIAEADLLVATGDPLAAEGVLREALELDPDSAVAIDALATVLGRDGRLDEAEALLRERYGDADDLTRRLVELQLSAGRARLALDTLTPLIEAGERDTTLRTYYGIALGRVGRVAEARSVLEAVLAERPGLVLANRALSTLEQQARITADDAAVALDGAAAVAFEQAMSALERGDWVLAASGFAEARSITDAGLLAFYQGYALQRAGDQRGAIGAYDEARAQLGDNDVLLSNLGFAHLQLGRLDRALEALQLAVERNPANAQAHFNLGMAQFGIARFVDAIASFERAVELAPELSESAAPFVAESRRRSQP